MATGANKRDSSVNVGVDAASDLEQLLGHRFADPHLLELALTHRSFAYEAAGGAGASPDRTADPGKDNEQLEFLGDAVLGMLAAESLIRHFPSSREGELTRLRASVVSRKHLGKVGTRLNLGRWLRLGRTGSDSSSHTISANTSLHGSATLLANTVEAVIAAIYLDGGMDPTRRFIEREVLGAALPQLQRSVADGDTFSGAVGDFKSVLQEMLQAQGQATPEYRLVEESGPGHRRVFRIQLAVAGEALAEAQGSSKKDAQQEAARMAVELLRRRQPETSPVKVEKPAGSDDAGRQARARGSRG